MKLNRIGILLGLLAACGLWPAWAAVEDFIVTTRPLVIPERGTVQTVVILTGGAVYSFIPPPEWRYSPSLTERKLILQAHDFGATLNIHFVHGTTNAATLPDPEVLRDQISLQYPGAKFVREYECYTSARKGRAFDIERAVNVTNVVSMRLAYVPLETGVVEFDLTTPYDKFPKYNLLFGNLLTSFHIEPGPTRR